MKVVYILMALIAPLVAPLFVWAISASRTTKAGGGRLLARFSRRFASLALLCALPGSALNARADFQSFQFTNIVPALLTVLGYPTNTTTTNYWSAGVLPGQTNQYLLNWLTGTKIDVRNYNTVGFVFNANYTASNNAVIAFQIVKASASSGTGSPLVTINTNTSVVLANDWNTITNGGDFIQVTLPAGTNVAVNFRTNLDVSMCDYVGIYQETNNISGGAGAGGIGWASNILVGVSKKILPIKFP